MKMGTLKPAPHLPTLDQAIVRLGVASDTITGIEIYTGFFTGNNAPEISVEGVFAPDHCPRRGGGVLGRGAGEVGGGSLSWGSRSADPLCGLGGRFRGRRGGRIRMGG